MKEAILLIRMGTPIKAVHLNKLVQSSFIPEITKYKAKVLESKTEQASTRYASILRSEKPNHTKKAGASMGSCFFCKRKKEFCPYSGIGMITDEKDNVFGGGSDLRWELGSGTGSGINSPSLRTRWFQVALPKERAANSGEPVDDAGVPRTLHRPTHIAPFADRCCVGATDSWELADVMGSRVHQPHPTHIMPTVTRHGVGAANSLKSAVGHGSATHQSEGMLVALRHSPSPLKGEPPKPTHTGPIVSLPRMGAADSVKA